MKMGSEDQSKMRISLRIFFSKGSKTPIIGIFFAYGIKLVKGLVPSHNFINPVPEKVPLREHAFFSDNTWFSDDINIANRFV
jgi:hypothetical protein